MSACKTPWYSLTERHQWGKWEDKKEGIVKSNEGKEIGVVVIQERRCKNPDCNKVDVHTAMSSIYD